GVSTLCNVSTIVIQWHPPTADQEHLKLRDNYNLRYAKNFDPNNRTYITYALDVDKIELPGLLIELSKQYFQGLGELEEISKKESKEVNAPKVKTLSERLVYQCADCLTVYDQSYGDPSQNIQKDTPFEQLPKTYHCSLCEASKSNFTPIQLPKVSTT